MAPVANLWGTPMAVWNEHRQPEHSDLPQVCWAMRDGLKLTGREVAAVLNDVPLWRSRSTGTNGFTEQAASHYAKTPLPYRYPKRWLDNRSRRPASPPIDLRPRFGDVPSWVEVVRLASDSFGCSVEFLSGP